MPLLSLANLFAASQASADEPGDKIVAQIVEQWKQRQQAVDTVKYVCKGTIIYTAKTPEKEGKQRKTNSDQNFPLHYGLLLRLSANKVRKEVKTHAYFIDDDKYYPVESAYLCDGDSIFVHRPKEKFAPGKINLAPTAADWIICDFDQWKGNILSFQDYPPLFSVGIIPISRNGFPSVAELRPEISAKSFRFKGEFRKKGEDCYLIQESDNPHSMVNEYWVSKKKPGAVLHYRFSRSGMVRCTLDIEWKRNEVLGYSPVSWEYHEFTRSESPTLATIQKLKITELQIDSDLDAKLFTISTKPGDVILDMPSSMQSYYVSKDGKRILMRAGDSTTIWLSDSFGTVLTLLAVIALACFLIIYRIRAARAN